MPITLMSKAQMQQIFKQHEVPWSAELETATTELLQVAAGNLLGAFAGFVQTKTQSTDPLQVVEPLAPTEKEYELLEVMDLIVSAKRMVAFTDKQKLYSDVLSSYASWVLAINVVEILVNNFKFTVTDKAKGYVTVTHTPTGATTHTPEPNTNWSWFQISTAKR